MWIVLYIFIIMGLVVAGMSMITNTYVDSSELWAGFICLIISAIGVWILISDWKQDVDPESIKYYSCRIIEYPNDNPKVVCITSSDMRSIRDFDLYHPEKTIVKEYTYIARKGWVNWMNGSDYRYETILPNDEEYDEVKDKVITVVIK